MLLWFKHFYIFLGMILTTFCLILCNTPFSDIELQGANCSWWPAFTIAEFCLSATHHLTCNLALFKPQLFVCLCDLGKRVTTRRWVLLLVLQKVFKLRKAVLVFRCLLLRQLKHNAHYLLLNIVVQGIKQNIYWHTPLGLNGGI